MPAHPNGKSERLKDRKLRKKTKKSSNCHPFFKTDCTIIIKIHRILDIVEDFSIFYDSSYCLPNNNLTF